jgi:hypothetical protein
LETETEEKKCGYLRRIPRSAGKGINFTIDPENENKWFILDYVSKTFSRAKIEGGVSERTWNFSEIHRVIDLDNNLIVSKAYAAN